MKILGMLFIIGALLVGGFVLADIVPSYFESKGYVASGIAEGDKLRAQMETAKGRPAGEGDNEVQRLMYEADMAALMVRAQTEAMGRRRDEALVGGGIAIVGLALGIFLFKRGKKPR